MNNELYDNEKVDLSQLLSELAFCNKYGIKSLYYSNCNDGADGSENNAEVCESCSV